MVQVDVFWSYALGAGFALAASRQLVREEARRRSPHEVDNAPLAWWQSASFVNTLLFLALVFAPSGAYLLTRFPSWETMHVASGFEAIPAWLVTLFAFTNVTQGILGYWVTRRLLLSDRWRLASLQWLGGYFLMFFVLVHGWDGSGYVRFFSATPELIPNWRPAGALVWLGSEVALSLVVMGVVLLPLMLGWMSSWLHRSAPQGPSRPQLIGLILLGALGLSLGAAVVASLLIRALGWALGLPAFALATYLLLLRPGGLVWSFSERLLTRKLSPSESVHGEPLVVGRS